MVNLSLDIDNTAYKPRLENVEIILELPEGAT